MNFRFLLTLHSYTKVSMDFGTSGFSGGVELGVDAWFRRTAGFDSGNVICIDHTAKNSTNGGGRRWLRACS